MRYKSVVIIDHAKYLRNARFFSGIMKFTIASTAVGKSDMPSDETWWPRKLNSAIPNWHFSGPMIIPYSARWLNKIRKCFLCVAWSGLVKSKSFRYTNTKFRPRVTWSINLWNVCLKLCKPNGVWVKLKSLKGFVTAVLWMSDGSSGIW